MAYYRCGPTAIGSRASWSVTMESKLDRINYDRIFNAFERTNAFEYVRNTFEGKQEERHVGHDDIVVNRKMSSSFERADCALAAQTPCDDDEDFYREKILYSQARQLFPLQEDLADWINKTIGITYLSGENFLDELDNGAELCQLAAVIHERAREALDQGLIVGPVPAIRGRCWQRAARRSFFSRDNAENFITFCRELGVHENLLFESDDLVLHNQPRQVILCLLEVARLATKFNVEPPGLVQLEKEIAMEERDSGLDSAMSGAAWQFRDNSPSPTREKSTTEPMPSSPEPTDGPQSLPDNLDAESTKSGATDSSSDTDVPLRPTNELDKRVQLVTRLMERGCNCGSGKCSKLLKVKKVGEGRYNIAGRNVFIRLLKGRHMMVRVGGGWDTLEHFLSRHEPCQVRLVTQGRRDVLPLPTPPPAPPAHSPSHSPTPSPASSKNSLVKEPSLPRTSPSPTSSKNSLIKEPSLPRTSPSPASSKNSLTKEPSLSHTSPSPASSKNSLTKESSFGNVSPADSKAPSINGKTSPVDSKLNNKKNGKSSPLDIRRTSTPKPAPVRNRSALTLPLKDEKKSPARARKQSAPASYSTPNTPTGRSNRTPTELRKSLTSNALVTTPKKSRSMSIANKDTKCFGAERSAQPKKGRSASIASTPTELSAARKVRSQSLASTPVNEPRRPLLAHGKTRSMSLAGAGPVAGLTQAAIEESIRLSLEATIADHTSPKKPFLHIKAKYRSPPPREVPPR